MDELMHYGKKGQKWGVRLYQNKDGSLTPLGRIRYGSGNKSVSKSASTTTSSEKPKKKSVSEMSDQELQAAINRKRLEQEYARLNPQQISKGKKFAKAMQKHVINDVVVPAAKSAGKAYVEKKLKDALGIQEQRRRNNNNSN